MAPELVSEGNSLTSNVLVRQPTICPPRYSTRHGQWQKQDAQQENSDSHGINP
jgi:hypothetical protein